jgi:RNA polymerase sigma-70 factor (ECF subfamily)
MSTLDAARAWEHVDRTVRGYLHRDAATADDLAQEVFLRMRRGLDDLRSLDRLGPWVMRIARNALIDHLRRRRDAPGNLVDDAIHAPAIDCDDPADLAALSHFLRTQIAALPAHEAVAVRLVDVDGVSPSAAADQLGIGLSALKARLRRGRLGLRQAVDRCCAVTRDVRGRPTDCIPRTSGSPCACS